LLANLRKEKEEEEGLALGLGTGTYKVLYLLMQYVRLEEKKGW
jgi:hypothetical protein